MTDISKENYIIWYGPKLLIVQSWSCLMKVIHILVTTISIGDGMVIVMVIFLDNVFNTKEASLYDDISII